MLKDTTPWSRWGSNPGPFSHESSTPPLSHCAPYPDHLASEADRDLHKYSLRTTSVRQQFRTKLHFWSPTATFWWQKYTFWCSIMYSNALAFVTWCLIGFLWQYMLWYTVGNGLTSLITSHIVGWRADFCGLQRYNLRWNCGNAPEWG